MTPWIVVVGASLGGLRSLQALLGGLPAGFPAAVALVQHRPPRGGGELGRLLQAGCALPVAEVADKDPVAPGRVWLAPADYHLLVDRDRFALSTEPPVRWARPSIDVLFETAADAFGRGTVGVVLTGSNDDGARGAERIRRRGGVVIVEDPEAAECPIMPAAARPFADHVRRVEGISPLLVALCSAWRDP